MADREAKRIKNVEQYEALRDQGASKQKAARIANAKNPGKKGGKNDPYEEWTREELYQKAREIGIEGRSSMNKADLKKALRRG
ncbi:MAG: Rho termination factor [Salinisphaeraceae bacterium]|jgi:hypothetical protein|nr:Rho termination factor [Salinisphaeraceae bacterium]